MKRELKHYMGLGYKIEIRPIAKEEGGGFEARIPQLGGDAFCGYGDTTENALRSLNEIKEEMFRNYIESDIEIPVPTDTLVIDECMDDYIYSSDIVTHTDYGLYQYALAS